MSSSSANDLRGSPSKVRFRNRRFNTEENFRSNERELFIQVVAARHALGLLHESAKDQFESLSQEDLGTIILCCSDPQLFDAVFDAYTEWYIDLIFPLLAAECKEFPFSFRPTVSRSFFRSSSVVAISYSPFLGQQNKLQQS